MSHLAFGVPASVYAGARDSRNVSRDVTIATTGNQLEMLKTDNLLSGYPFIG